MHNTDGEIGAVVGRGKGGRWAGVITRNIEAEAQMMRTHGTLVADGWAGAVEQKKKNALN